jgi:glutamate-1-semialdehyde aminotransferase
MNEPVRDYRHFATASGPAKRLAAIHARMLDEGVIITKAGTACLSTPMGDAEVDAFVNALDRALDHVPA